MCNGRHRIVPRFCRTGLSGSVVLAAVLLSGCVFDLSLRPSDPPINRKVEHGPSCTVGHQGSFSEQTLYQLLVAEMAAHRTDYETTLANYVKQAETTRDEGVIERAYHVATYAGAMLSARDMAKLWLEVSPDCPSALVAMGVETARNGDREAGMKLLLQARKAGGGDVPFSFVAVQAEAGEKEERDDLLQTFKRELSHDHRNVELRMGYGLLLYLQGQTKASLKELDAALKRSSGNLQALLFKGRILHESGRTQEAVALLSEMVRRHPQAHRIRLLYARTLMKNGNIAGAQEQFDAILQQRPDDPDVLLAIALIAMNNDMPGKAGAYFHKLAEIPAYADVALLHLGRLAAQMHDWREGRRHFLRVPPGKHLMQARIELVHMLADHQQLSLARSDLHNDRKKFPSRAVHFYLIEGELLLKHDQTELAAKVYDLALEKFADHQGLLYARAMLADKLGDVATLEKMLRRILTQDPQNAVVLNALGYSLLDQPGRLKESAQLIHNAFALNPDDPAVVDSLGWLEFRQGNYTQAVKHLRRAYRQLKDPEVAVHLVEALWAAGRTDEARSVWKESLQQNPDHKLLKKTIDRLEIAKTP